jgi:hypothetical protein
VYDGVESVGPHIWAFWSWIRVLSGPYCGFWILT